MRPAGRGLARLLFVVAVRDCAGDCAGSCCVMRDCACLHVRDGAGRGQALDKLGRAAAQAEFDGWSAIIIAHPEYVEREARGAAVWTPFSCRPLSFT